MTLCKIEHTRCTPNATFIPQHSPLKAGRACRPSFTLQHLLHKTSTMASMLSTSDPPTKKLHNSTEDRLTTLPKDILDFILTCMSLKDAVRTSILSHVWRYKWCDLPNLVFDYHHFPPSPNQLQIDYDRKLVKIVDQILLLHRGPVRRFQLSVPLDNCGDIDRWILFLSRNGVRELIIYRWAGQIYKIPSCLFSCGELTYLQLSRCILVHPPASFCGFGNLIILDLWYVYCTERRLEWLVYNCPLLRKLGLKRIVGCNRLKIFAPNLVELEVSNNFIDLCFVRTSLLAKASITLKASEEQRLPTGGVCKLVHLLGRVPSIRKLKLLGESYQIYSAGDVPIRLHTTCQLLHLSVSMSFQDMQELLAAFCIFRSCPFLQNVDIQSISHADSAEMSVDDFWKAQEDFNCFLSGLRILNMTGCTGTTAELKFIEFVLVNAPLLEMVKIRLGENASDVTGILRKLVQFRRISANAKIVIPE